ncbi:beta-hexosaminidase subunit alpha-like [Melitaea cinxia]|uniref:beta-hexosaminidase subunit alpha-like n=1 Tax=Melitaea cinxia TaxID=113334 RepID=UPI001E271343|nr:beta-hexosaminidase subunit alpha-like [Melitaea cinxia]
MLKLVIFLVCFAGIFAENFWIIKPGPKYPPTKGEVWPKPQYQIKENTFYILIPRQFEFKATDQTCDDLTTVVERYSFILSKIGDGTGKRVDRSDRGKVSEGLYKGHLKKLEIVLTQACEAYPHLHMDESYNLTVSATSTLHSRSLWGVMRGLETFAQLFYLSDDRNEIRINTTQIYDFPRYKHRGLLLDTSRHFISVTNILKTLDAMEMNKMNVFHWHIVDDQSFPYRSEKYPELSNVGAFDSSMTYSKEDIQTVIEFARIRGIRVIPEFDVPGHTASWGSSHPHLLTECYQGNRVVGLGPMDPTKNSTYQLLRELFHEVQTLFPDSYFHIGGDEVGLDCWKSNPELREFMKTNKLTVSDLHALFIRKVIPLLVDNSKLIVWQEVFDEGVSLTKDTLIQVWKYNWISEMINILESGHKLIFSSTWYLSAMNSEWPDFYLPDPRKMVYDITRNETLLPGIVGGEACMWGEMVDDRNVINRVWPRASAVAERLWSTLDEKITFKIEIPTETYHRIEEHACRMIRRGMNAQPPSGPGFCLA